MDFLKNEWFKILIVILLIAFISIYYKNNTSSKNELYKINTSCADDARAFAKGKSDDFTRWEVIRSTFSEVKQSCYGEFKLNSGAIIYDLTHNEEQAFRPNYVPDVNTAEYTANYTEYAKKYEAVKTGIFGKVEQVGQ